MKKNHILFTLALFGIGITTINAAPSYNFKVSSGSITNGSKVTASVTVSGAASWQIKITSSGNTGGCSGKWADATSDAKNITKTFTTTACKANSTGIISFRLEGNITDEAGNTVNLSGTKTVTVKEKAPDSKINTLSSLKIDGFDLSPTFDSEVLEYSVVVPPNTTKINISATKKDSTSTVSGTGEFEVTEGDNQFKIDVKAQNGDLRTYTINVSVTDENPIKVNVDNEEYTILKTSRNLEIPSLYNETTCTIEEETVPCFINENTNITLVALKNNLGVTNFFIYEDNKYTKYYELVSDNLIIMPTNNSLNLKGYVEKEITINDNKVKAYQYKKLDNSLYKDYMFFIYILGGAAGIIILSLITIMILSSKNRKARKLAIVLEEKIKHKDKEIEKIKKIYNNNKHKKRNKSDKNEINGETSNIKISQSETSTSSEKDDLDDTTENYNILKD